MKKLQKIIVIYSNISVCLTDKASAMVYFDNENDGSEIYAKGESDDFVIQAGLNSAKIILKKYNSGDEPQNSTPPSGVPLECFIGECRQNTNGYILTFYENNKYAI